jgi:hypothetical protein
VERNLLKGIAARRIIKPPCDSECCREFSSGDYSKVTPINRTDERSLQPGPLCRIARERCWAYAYSAP